MKNVRVVALLMTLVAVFVLDHFYSVPAGVRYAASSELAQEKATDDYFWKERVNVVGSSIDFVGRVQWRPAVSMWAVMVTMKVVTLRPYHVVSVSTLLLERYGKEKDALERLNHFRKDLLGALHKTGL